MEPLAEKWTPPGEAVDSKLKQKDLREKLLRKKLVNCRATKTKRWKEKETLIEKMRSEDLVLLKEEATKLMSRLKEEAENKNKNQSSVFQDDSIKRGRKEDLKEEDDGRVSLRKLRNSLARTAVSNCSLEEYFNRRKERTEGKTAKQDILEQCGISKQGTDVKKQKKKVKIVEKSKNKHGVKKKKHEKKEYMRLKEEEASKNVQKELVEEILSEKGWSEMPDSYGDKKAFKKFKKLLKRKVDEKLAQCRLQGRRGVEAKLGDINHNVVGPSSEKAELVQVEVEVWDMKELSVEAKFGKVADATLSGEGCVEENYDGGGINELVAEVAAVTEEVVSEEGSTEEEEGVRLDISEDLKAEEEDPGYIQWKLAYLKSKLKELEEKEALRTSTCRDCDERGSPEMRLSEGRVWISEESIDDSKDGQIETGDMSEAEGKGSILGVADMELEEGEVFETEVCVESQEEERVFNVSMSLPSGFLEAVVKACTKEPAVGSVLKLVKKKAPAINEGCKKSFEQKAALEDARSSEPDPRALEHLDLRPPQSSYPPFTLMMHQQVVSALTDCEFKKRSSEGFDITRHDLCSLTGLRWLNDQVIQVYLSLVVERSSWTTFREQHMPKVLAMSTFIYQNIMRKSRGHAAVASWTSNMNLFENDLVLFPMHVDFSHWVLAVADFRSKTITSYDSMGNTHQASLEAILAYLDSEHKATKGLKLKGFWMCQAADCPQQENTADCGVFLCRIAESLTREAGSGTFTQADMPYLRRRCLFEIIRGKLL